LLLLLLVACTGNGGSAPAPVTPPASIEGDWLGVIHSQVSGRDANVESVFTGSNATGYDVTGTVAPVTCYPNLVGRVVVTGFSVAYTNTNPPGLTMSGVLDATGAAISGSYAISVGACAIADHGTISLRRALPALELTRFVVIDIDSQVARIERGILLR